MKIRISINSGISNISFRPENQNIEIKIEECLNPKQHNPNLENTADYELFEEAKNVEHVEIREHHEKSESSIIEVEDEQKGKPKTNRRKDLHLRQDVVNKTLLRAVKRFYSNKFKSIQKSMVRKRFKNIKTSDVLDALVNF